MTISSTANRVSYTGNGVTTAFAYPYLFTADSDLVVIETIIATGVETTKALTTDYTVTGADNPNGGTVTAVTAPASTVTWTIFRDPPQTQKMDLVENDPLPAEVLEGALDKLTMLLQRVTDKLTRMPQLQETTAVTPLPLVFPEPGASGDVLGWNAGGALTNVTDISSSLSASLSGLLVGDALRYTGTVWENTPATPFIVRSTDHTATVADRFGTLLISGTVTVTLPAASAFVAGEWLRVVNVGGNPVTVSRAGSDTIDGIVYTVVLPESSNWVLLASDGVSVWRTVSERRTEFITQAYSALSPAATISVAHSFSPRIPRIVHAYLLCTTPDLNYGQGLVIDNASWQGGGAHGGFNVNADNSNITIQSGVDLPEVPDRTVGANLGKSVTIGPSKWSAAVQLEMT